MTLCDECEFTECDVRNKTELDDCGYKKTLRRKRDEIQRTTESKTERCDTEGVTEGSLQHNRCDEIAHAEGLHGSGPV